MGVGTYDYVVKWDPAEGTEVLTARVLNSLFLRRLKNKKPAVIYIGGDSGEGKSTSALRLMELLLSYQGLDAKHFINDINVYVPLQYPQKIKALLFDKRLKKVNFICIHEARELIKAAKWQSFLTQAVADINATSRAIKRLGIIIISQFIRDITADNRYTLNYYCMASRPSGRPARLYISKLWKDDRDLEKPRLRKRKIRGQIIFPDGRRVTHTPQYFEVSLPSKELREVFEKSDRESKEAIIKRKLAKLMEEMKQEIGDTDNKVSRLTDFYAANDEALLTIGKRHGAKFKLNKDFVKIHDLTKQEEKAFLLLLEEKRLKKSIEVIYDET